jgi:hypothetical protein
VLGATTIFLVSILRDCGVEAEFESSSQVENYVEYAITYGEAPDIQASDQSSEYYSEAIAKVASFFKAPPVVENYEAEIYS